MQATCTRRFIIVAVQRLFILQGDQGYIDVIQNVAKDSTGGLGGIPAGRPVVCLLYTSPSPRD